MAPSIDTNNYNVTSSIIFPFAVKLAIELGIFDILAKVEKGIKLSAEDIAVKIGSPEGHKMLDRLLRLLVSHSMLYCSLSEDQQQHASPKILYSLAPAAEYFVLGDNDDLSFEPALKLGLDKVLMESWYCIKGAILEGGIPFNRAYGMPIYEYAGVNPRFNDIFNKAMGSITTIIMKRVLECYNGFEHINTLVDVGGGLGITLKLIKSKHSHIHGVIENAQTYPGITHVEGDMFESVPKGDAIFLKWILHNWNDERCLKLLKNCYKATPNDGKVIALESILPVLPENTMISKLGSKEDFYMMTLQGGGKERTQNEFIELALGSGFSGIKFIGCFSSNWVMEFFK